MPNLWNLDHLKPREGSAIAGETLPAMFRRACEQRAGRVAMRQKHLGIWRGWRWDEVAAIVRELSMGFASLGVAPGECVSILSNTRPEWVWCDMAAMSVGAVSNGIYPNSTAEQLQFVCEDSRTVLLVVEDEEQLDKVFAVRAALPALRHIVLLQHGGGVAVDDPMVITLAGLRERGTARDAADPGEYDRLREAVRPQDVAALIYTSGTTGVPRGAMHSHAGLLAAVRAQAALLPQDERDERICFLSLCHVTERVTGCYVSLYCGCVMNFVENPDTVPENVREIGPTVFGGMPRLWEKLYSSVTLAVQEAGPVQQALYAWALGVGHEVAARVLAGQPVGPLLRCKYRLAGFAALDHVRRFLGIHRCRFLATGAAPISPELVRWYLALGVPMLESWASTESAGIAISMPPWAMRPGSVGKPAPQGEVRVDALTGELMVRGPGMFVGYVNQPERTAEAFDTGGWLRTGDAGAVDAAGYVRITGRLSEMLETADGRRIAPAEWENELKSSPYVTDALVVADGRAFPAAIVLIEQETVEKFAQDHDIPFSSYASLARSPEIRALVQAEVDKANAKLPREQRVGNFMLLETQLGAEDEELTPTMKLRRGVVQRKYAREIEAMYA